MGKLLLLLPALPYPPRQGAALRNWGMIQALHDAGHELCLLCAAAGEIAPELRERCLEIRCVHIPPRKNWRRLVDWLLRGKADLVERLRQPRFQRELVELLATHSFAAIQLEGLEMTTYLADLAATNSRLVYDAHNAESALQTSAAMLHQHPVKRWYSLSQARRLARHEAAVCAQVDVVIAVSEEDATQLRQLAPTAQIQVIPNAIDAGGYDVERAEAAVPTLVFSGKMDYRPNIDAVLWFQRAVWPRMRKAHPQLRWQIVGSAPSPAVRRLAADEKIEVTGSVAEVLPYLTASTVYVAPLRMGSGTRLKMLEAMAAGCAIVATPMAAAGLPGAGTAFLAAETAEEFAKAISSLLQDAPLRAALGAAGRSIVAEQFDWRRIVPLIQAIHEGDGASRMDSSRG
ncbi:MAG: glycosyltransferase [Chloroflexi bacterium]|nr:glycosyltransferase [Chloroflexota bacterium]